MDIPKENDPITNLLTSYDELNSHHIDELHEEPSALEFMRYVAQNRPFVIRKGASDWEATRLWSKDYLLEKMGEREVVGAVTPFGNADSPTVARDGRLIFVKPLETPLPFPTLLSKIINPPKEVYYSQTQNSNLRDGEYIPLYTSIPSTLSFARIALQKPPDAINLWIGNSQSVTALHRDNYENIFVQVRGKKSFVLLPALAVAVVEERVLDVGRYVRGEGGELVVEMEEGEKVPFATWDPDGKGTKEGRYAGLVREMRVELGEGDVLYLPAMWYHKVSQTCGDEGFACSVNYWYDMEYSGSLYPLCSFARDVALSNRNPS